MNNNELAAALRAIDKRQTECECRHYCCCGCECWDESCENECKILSQAAEALEKAAEYEKVLADFSKVVNAGFQAMAEQKEKPAWISVKDRTPEKEGNYITARRGCVFVESWNGAVWSEIKQIGQPTNWMPLPEPPELEVGTP